MDVAQSLHAMSEEAEEASLVHVLTPQPIRISTSQPSPTLLVFSPSTQLGGTPRLSAFKTLWPSEGEDGMQTPHLSHFESGACLWLGKPFLGLGRKQDCAEEALRVPLSEKQRLGRPQCCKCQKSRCLKLYCDCFAVGQYCLGCSCVDCLNTPNHENLRSSVMTQVLEKNREAFREKIREERHSRGCNCRKSACLKKYCECYQSQVACTDTCKCYGCRNQHRSKRTAENLSREANR